jgi:trk system potassium uptake protein TrkA
MKFAVIGYGSFGSNMAKTLFAKGHEVLVIDKDRERVAAAKDFATNAVMTDSAVKENLEALGLRDMDVVVVSMGHEMEASVLTTLYLRELGAKRILTKALSEDHAKVLEAVGATEVVYPEKDMAVRTALRLSSPNILEYLPLSHGITIQGSRWSPSRRSSPITSSSSPGRTSSSRTAISSFSSARRNSSARFEREAGERLPVAAGISHVS